MTTPQLTDVFGAGATRLASGATTSTTGLFIPDSVLVAMGLTTPSTATAEAHLAAILLAGLNNLTQTNYGTNLGQTIYATQGYSSFATRSDNNQWRIDQVTFNLAKIDSGATIDPADY